MKELFDKSSLKCSKVVTRTYSTSFSMGIYLLDKEFKDPVYAIYGFVRFADEIVDSFHKYNKSDLLQQFKDDTYKAIDEKISLNPILNSFQWVVNKYSIPLELIELFLKSMEMDLDMVNHDNLSLDDYILGSAEVVGLMCLKVFVRGDEKVYNSLKPSAMKLGSAFQKINFLRDLKDDYKIMGRTYFPDVDYETFDDKTKQRLEADILIDFKDGFEGIKKLPKSARFGVYVAYTYYFKLFKKIQKIPAKQLIQSRIRVSNTLKFLLLFKSYFRNKLNLL